MATAEAIDGPRFRYPSPDGPLLRELVAGYERVTGVAVSWPKKRNYIASCYRVHGTAFLTLVEQMFVAKGSDTNLLRELRQRQPAVVDTAEPATVIFGEQHPGLTYGPGGRPPFDPTSKRRYDRHPSNPDADGFFRDDELTVPTDRPSVKALTR